MVAARQHCDMDTSNLAMLPEFMDRVELTDRPHLHGGREVPDGGGGGGGMAGTPQVGRAARRPAAHGPAGAAAAGRGVGPHRPLLPTRRAAVLRRRQWHRSASLL